MNKSKGKDKSKTNTKSKINQSPNQSSITSFFNNKASCGLFSTFGSSNLIKNEKKVLNLSTKKKKLKEVEGSGQCSINTNTKVPKKASDITPTNKDTSSTGKKNNDQVIADNLTTNYYPFSKNMPVIINHDKTVDFDDDVIPPTPSPGSCHRSFMRPSSLIECNREKTGFTSLKQKQIIDRKERFIKESKHVSLQSKESSRIHNKIIKAEESLFIEENAITSSSDVNADLLLEEITSDISSSRRAGITQFKSTPGNNNIKRKSLLEPSTFNKTSLKLTKKAKLDINIDSVDPPVSKTDATALVDSNTRTLAPQKIVMKKAKVKSLKRSVSKGLSPSSKRHHGDQTLCGLQEGKQQNQEDESFDCCFDEDDQSMASLYVSGLLSTPTNSKQTILTEGPQSKEKSMKDSSHENTHSKTTDGDLPKTSPTEEKTVLDSSPVKTPMKFDGQLINDISLITPKKNSPNISCDSLLEVEVDSLMDGLEWSPMPKKTIPRSKLFEEYTPHSTPYSRFLVLEVYRREANNEEAVSKYGRVLSEKVLRLFDESSSVERYCYLRQDWEMTEVEPGDVVHVTGEFDATSGVCILDNKNDQYLVVHPDTLVSGTTVAGATRCLRRSILNERFRTEDTNEAMLMGTLLHELFDNAMQSNEFSTKYLISQAKSLLEQHSYLDSLFSLGMTEVTAMDKITSILPEFSKWAKQYMHSTPEPDLGVMDYKTASETADTQEKPSVCIAELKDIEENVWSPRFGLKGKVDATVEVKIDRRPKIRRHRPDKDNTIQSCIVPLELKTGKVFSKLGSVDHRAQVILYTLLLSDRHRHTVDSGLLYYMKASYMVGVPALVHEKRALIMRRNEVARYLSLSRTTGGRQMPGMLKDAHTCNRCSQAKNCTLFHKSLENGDHVTSGLGDDFTKLTQHLTPDHTRFFADWFKLVCLEGKEVQQSGKTSQHHIWSLKGLEREALGQCFSGLVLSSRDHKLGSDKMYVHKFERSADSPVNTPFVEIPLSSGDRIVVSEEQTSAVAIASGYIRNVEPHEVTVTLDRDLLKSYRSSSTSHQAPIYRLDKNDGYNTLTTLWSNIAKLLHNDTARNEQLRQLIIELKPPVFCRSRQALINFNSQSSMGTSSQDSQQSKSSQTSKPIYRDAVTESYLEGLNIDQKRAIMKVLCAEDYTLILGMPGTGKTTTIARLVRIMVNRGKTVLLTSYTHTAVDNILLKLKQDNVDFLRLGQVHKMLPEIQPYSVHVAGAHIKTVNHLKEFYLSKNVVATTCLGVNHALFSQRSFDYCIVDEASQITLPVCLGPLHYATVFVLVGDHYQLPPLVQSLEAREGGMDISLFKRLSEHHPQAMVCLEHQYRMNQDIMALSNNLIYENRLKCGTEQVANTVLCIPRWNKLVSLLKGLGSDTSENWLMRALEPKQSVLFLNTDNVPGYESRKERLVSNETEAILVQQLTCALQIGGVARSSVGIMSPYRHQLKLIRDALGQDPRDSRGTLEINTVDKYQGRDKLCIIVSLVRSNESSSVGDLLKDWRRVNVAVTRAKSKLILIGSLSTLKASLLLNELLDLVQRKNLIYDLPKDAHKMYVDLEQEARNVSLL